MGTGHLGQHYDREDVRRSAGGNENGHSGEEHAGIDSRLYRGSQPELQLVVLLCLFHAGGYLHFAAGWLGFVVDHCPDGAVRALWNSPVIVHVLSCQVAKSLGAAMQFWLHSQ